MKRILSLSIITLLLASCTLLKGQQKDSYKVLLQTSMGDITLKLYEDIPQHSTNFIKLVKEGFYDSLLFHRVIPQFMIQGGDPDSKKALNGQQLGNGDVGYKIPAEFNTTKYIHRKGVLAAARDGNPEKASSGCQFYIVVGKTFLDADLDKLEAQKGIKYTEEQRKIYREIGGTPHLDNDYTVYGEVMYGMDVVEKIAAVNKDALNRPTENVYILKAIMMK